MKNMIRGGSLGLSDCVVLAEAIEHHMKNEGNLEM